MSGRDLFDYRPEWFVEEDEDDSDDGTAGGGGSGGTSKAGGGGWDLEKMRRETEEAREREEREERRRGKLRNCALEWRVFLWKIDILRIRRQFRCLLVLCKVVINFDKSTFDSSYSDACNLP